MKYSIVFLLLLSSFIISAQNVGVNTTNPTERLDVNGNINVRGTIKANGVDGTANQVLRKNNSGVLEWGDLCNYNNLVAFTIGNGTWIVPVGVTKLMVEAWGGGGGGGQVGGGGGGGYVRAVFNVNPGDLIQYHIGTGGLGNNPVPGAPGDTSTVTIGTYIVKAVGGEGGDVVSVGTVVAEGGDGFISGTPLHRDVMVIEGEKGKVNMHTFVNNGNTVYEISSGGHGGNGANSENTGGPARQIMQLAASPFTSIRSTLQVTASPPGGGGGAGYRMIGSGNTSLGNNGARGLVQFRY